MKHHPELNQFDNATVMIPKTVVLCTDLFEEFMDHNNLYQLALSDADDAVILDALPPRHTSCKFGGRHPHLH